MFSRNLWQQKEFERRVPGDHDKLYPECSRFIVPDIQLTRKAVIALLQLLGCTTVYALICSRSDFSLSSPRSIGRVVSFMSQSLYGASYVAWLHQTNLCDFGMVRVCMV